MSQTTATNSTGIETIEEIDRVDEILSKPCVEFGVEQEKSLRIAVSNMQLKAAADDVLNDHIDIIIDATDEVEIAANWLTTKNELNYFERDVVASARAVMSLLKQYVTAVKHVDSGVEEVKKRLKELMQKVGELQELRERHGAGLSNDVE